METEGNRDRNKRRQKGHRQSPKHFNSPSLPLPPPPETPSYSFNVGISLPLPILKIRIHLLSFFAVPAAVHVSTHDCSQLRSLPA
jgi:hypothetical protein